MKIGKLKVKKTATGLLLCVLTCAALLFSACDGILDKPETEPVKAGYGKLYIQLVNEDAPFELGSGARTAIPDLTSQLDSGDITWSFTSDNGGGGPQVLTVDSDGLFTTLANGTYTIAVVGKNAGNKEILAGQADNVVIKSNTVTVPIVVKMADNSTDKGTLSIKLGVPAGTAVSGFLFPWTGTAFGSKTDIAFTVTGGSAVNSTTLNTLTGGSYLLRLSLTNNGKSVGIVEAVHIYPTLETTYRKTFTADDFIGATKITSVAIEVPRPVDTGAIPTAITTVTGSGIGVTFNVGTTLSWVDKDGTAASSAFDDTDAPYTVSIRLTPMDGFTFLNADGSLASSPTINGTGVKMATDANGAKEWDIYATDNKSIILKRTFTNAYTITSIGVSGSPKTSYTYPEALDLSGLSIRINYSGNGGNKVVPYADFVANGLTVATEDQEGDSYTLGNPLAVVQDNNGMTPGDPLGPYTVTITHTASTKTTSYDVTVGKRNLTNNSDVSVTVSPDSYEFTGLIIEPGLGALSAAVTVKYLDNTLSMDSGTVAAPTYDGVYVLGHENAISVGDKTARVRVTGVGNYTGTAFANFTIYAKDTSKLVASFNGGDPLPFTGSAQALSFTITDNGADVKSKFNDPTANLSAAQKTNIGTYSVTFNGNTGTEYQGKTVTASYTIAKRDVSTLVGTDITVTPTPTWGTANYPYTGNEVKPTSIAITDSGVSNIGLTASTLIKDTHYTVSYSGDIINQGTNTAKLIITGIGNYYQGTKEISYSIGRRTLVPADDIVLPTRTFKGTSVDAITASDIQLRSGLTGLGSITGISYTGIPSSFYANSGTPPIKAGSYSVIVATLGEGDNFVSGAAVTVGTLVINPATPDKSIFNDILTTPVVYDATSHSITPVIKTALTTGSYLSNDDIKAVWYKKGTERTTTAPVNVGDYTVLVELYPSANFTEGEADLGTLKITQATPDLTDHFDVTFKDASFDSQVSGGLLTVKLADLEPVVAKLKTSPLYTGAGAITVKYKKLDGSNATTTTLPTTTGNYLVTVEVAEGTNFKATTDPLVVGTLNITAN